MIPAAPTSVTFLPATGASSQLTNLNNSASGKALQFQVSGVTSGNLVEVLADGNVIGQTTANGTTVIVTTDGSTKLTDGSHTFTAIQIAQNQMVTVNESDSSNTTTGTTAEPATANVPSLDCSAISLTVNTTVAGISSTQATGAYRAGTAIPITVTFSEAVTVTGTPQLTLNVGSGVVANYASGSGTATLTFNYTVAAGQNTSDLDYASTTALALDGGTIQNATSNAAVLTLPATGTDGLATQNIAIDTTAPTVTGVSSTQAAGAYGAGTTIPITVTFSEPVTVTGTPQLTLNDAASGQLRQRQRHCDAHLQLHGGGGREHVRPGLCLDRALALNGGSIEDAAGNAAALTLPATGTDGLATQNIVIDTTPPAVTAVSSTQAAGAYAAGTTIPITVTFSEAVTVTGTPQLTLNDGGGGHLRQRQRHRDAHVQLHRGGGQKHADLDYASTTALSLQWRQHPGRGGQRGPADPAGHRHRRPGDPEHRHRHDAAGGDGGILDASGRDLRGGDDDPDHGHLQRGGHGDGHAATDAQRAAVANYASGSGTATLTFNYTVAAGQNTSDLDYASTAALALNGGSIQDAAGNAAVLTLPATGSDGLATQNIVIDTDAAGGDGGLLDASGRGLSGRGRRSRSRSRSAKRSR